MKRKNILIRIPIAVLILLCAGPAFTQNSGVITELSGTVELKTAGAADFITAKAGDSVARETIVSTGFKSNALITVGSTVLTVRPLTRLTLREISASAGTETLNVGLQTGRVRVDVNPPAGTRAVMTVQSPVATASVRGTSFEFDTQSLTVLEGTVAFQGSQGGTMQVGAGSSSEVTDNGRALDPAEASAAGIMPPQLSGTDAGFRQSGAGAAVATGGLGGLGGPGEPGGPGGPGGPDEPFIPDSNGEFGFIFELR